MIEVYAIVEAASETVVGSTRRVSDALISPCGFPILEWSNATSVVSRKLKSQVSMLTSIRELQVRMSDFDFQIWALGSFPKTATAPVTSQRPRLY
jgi:hypothetical protein